MKLKVFLLTLLVMFVTSDISRAELQTETVTIGGDSEGYTKVIEQLNNSESEKTPVYENTVYVPVPYIPPTGPYPYSYYPYSSYYNPSMYIRYSSRPNNCYYNSCSGIKDKHPLPPPGPGQKPPPYPKNGGMQIYTNFAGGYSYGNDPRTWTKSSFGQGYAGGGFSAGIKK